MNFGQPWTEAVQHCDEAIRSSSGTVVIDFSMCVCALFGMENNCCKHVDITVLQQERQQSYVNYLGKSNDPLSSIGFSATFTIHSWWLWMLLMYTGRKEWDYGTYHNKNNKIYLRLYYPQCWFFINVLTRLP